MKVQIIESINEPNTYHIVDHMTGEILWEHLVMEQVTSICNQLGYVVVNNSERGNTLLGYALLLTVVGLFVYAGLGLLGIVPNVVPTMYAWIVSFFA